MALDNMIDDYKAKTGRSRELFEEALRVMPGGNSRTTTFFDPYPFYITRGEGARLWDADGVERLDFNGNYTSLILGHANPQVVSYIQGRPTPTGGFITQATSCGTNRMCLDSGRELAGGQPFGDIIHWTVDTTKLGKPNAIISATT